MNPAEADGAVAGAEQLPSVVVRRTVEWVDTDASGHQHHSAVLRWVEAAERVLLARRGVADLYGRIPRVRYEVDYRNRLWFQERLLVEIAVAHVGERSMRYTFAVSGEQGVAAAGTLVVAFAAPDAPRAVPWPPEVRAALTTGGPQTPET